MVDSGSTPLTPASLVDDLRGLGIVDGDVVMVHASLRAIGRVEGGAQGVIAALDDAVGPTGGLLMILGARDDWDWVNQRPEADRPRLLADAEPFDPLTTPAAARRRRAGRSDAASSRDAGHRQPGGPVRGSRRPRARAARRCALARLLRPRLTSGAARRHGGQGAADGREPRHHHAPAPRRIPRRCCGQAARASVPPRARPRRTPHHTRRRPRRRGRDRPRCGSTRGGLLRRHPRRVPGHRAGCGRPCRWSRLPRARRTRRAALRHDLDGGEPPLEARTARARLRPRSGSPCRRRRRSTLRWAGRSGSR